ncbi:HlyD family efflux transporter periplasmic adaptor subunit [Aquibium sp. A9E412]|uniref:HlyD family secretion protein n=1 Tax=Aquibium sp. A9E412 TaxID=2976767 RepID=UPI0025B12211|nr:HlyD family efflux transporter periplasmic adaptor subunit [Aquibium sp. A9E412]MDN2566448.1 HlyD family efflux transporter periplasmic adaptor subunit [Aquibium sp. A9E412]
MSWLCALPLVAGLLSTCPPEAPLAVGYVEGEYVLLAPTEVAQVRSVAVRRGDRVAAGQPVASMEQRGVALAVAQAEAALAEAEAHLADLKHGKRPEEIAVLEAARESARAEAAEAERVLARTRDLFERGIATQAELDKATTAQALAAAKLGQADANLAVARLPARAETIAAARYRRDQAAAALDQARWRLGERTIAAPAAGRIDDVVRSAGDIAGPSAPVISMLPDGAIKLKLYLPETAFSALAVGDRLAVRCDGCPDGLAARVSYVSPDPEFTPPVIYSLETRQKLVYLVEARPEGEAGRLKPGQIVDVAPARDPP